MNARNWPQTVSLSLLAMGSSCPAFAQIGADCLGPPPPAEFAKFPEFPPKSLETAKDIRGARAHRVSFNTSTVLVLHFTDEFLPEIPFKIIPHPPFYPFGSKPVAGGFVAFPVTKPGLYRLATREAWDLMEVARVEHPRIAIKPLRVSDVPCSIGSIQDYRLVSGEYIIQFYSTHSNHAFIKLVRSGK